jgi:hypothetical protein
MLGMWVAGALAATPYQDGYGGDPRTPLTYPFERVAPTPTHDRKFELEVGVRVRNVSVPGSVMDLWYFDDDNPDWAWIEGRPKIAGTAMGLEFNVVGNTGSNGIFWTEYIDSRMKAGYWDDLEDDQAVDHLDGDFVAPSAGTGLVAFGGDYAYEAKLVTSEQTDGRFGLGFVVGGGLGLGILTGRLDQWTADDEGNPSYKRYLDGLPPDGGQQIPRVYPMVDVNGGLRFTFGDRVSWRLEGGLHTLLYYGSSLAVRF